MNLFKKKLKKILMLVPIFISFISVNINASANTKLTVNTWMEHTISPGFTKRYMCATEVVNGKVYFIGGHYGLSTNEASNVVQEYDPETNIWTTKSPMPTKRYDFGSVVVDGKIYCIGGNDMKTGSVNVLEIYDPVTDRWTSRASMPEDREQFGIEAVGGKIYCFGGYEEVVGSGFSKGTNFEYNITTNQWTQKQELPIHMTGMKTAVVDGKIYSLRKDTLVNKLDRYDPASDSWELEISKPTGRDCFGFEVLDNQIYCFGGFGMLGNVRTVQSYDYLTNKWTNKGSLPYAYQPYNSWVLDGKIYSLDSYDDETGTIPMHIYITESIVLLEANKAVEKAESTRLVEDIEYARSLIVQLSESAEKNELIGKLDAIEPIITIEKESITSNADIYIKMANTLSLTLDTNNVIFEDFTGVEDVENEGAINLTVESSLPYEINAFLESEIQNSDMTEIVDKSILGIKVSDNVNYETFNSVNTALKLLDNQVPEDVNTHSIDLMLRKDKIVKADIYKTTIRFEVKQK